MTVTKNKTGDVKPNTLHQDVSKCYTPFSTQRHTYTSSILNVSSHISHILYQALREQRNKLRWYTVRQTYTGATVNNNKTII